MSTGGGSDAEEAARINTELSQKYKAVGLPAVKGGLGYATGALEEPLPQYAESAYRMAKTTALETGVAKAQTARARLTDSLRLGRGGGPALADLAKVTTGSAEDLAQEVGSIGAARATGHIEQRNKLLSILTGGGASATDLAAGFGNLNVRSLGVLGENPGAYPYIVGGASLLAPSLAKLLQPKSSLGGSVAGAG